MPDDDAPPEGEISVDSILKAHGRVLEAKLTERLANTPDIVRIAGRWFPTQLLADVTVVHLNLAEAVLDVSGGGQLPTADLLTHLGLPESVDPLLAAFSVDYAMQEDERFDEVGPTGQVLWYLRRLEPPEVLFRPPRLEPAIRRLVGACLDRFAERGGDDAVEGLAQGVAARVACIASGFPCPSRKRTSSRVASTSSSPTR